MATLQPGERELLYSAKSWSTRVDDGLEDDCLQPPSAAIPKVAKTRVWRGVWTHGRPVMEYITALSDRIGILFVDRAIFTMKHGPPDWRKTSFLGETAAFS
jgi:hypothetical protein